MALAHRARGVLALWRAEQRTLRQGFSALLISSGGDLLAGLTLGFMTDTLERLPALIVLIPAAIGMRGNIFGALGSRLGTGIHAGLFVPSRDRKSFLGQNVTAAAVLSLSTSLFLGVAAWTVSRLLGLESITVWDFVAISILGGIMGSVIDGIGAVSIAVASHRRSWDLDSVSAPMVTAIGDVGTLPCLWLASFIVVLPHVTAAVALVAGTFCLIATVRGLRSNMPIVRRVVRESMPLLLLAGMIDVFAGSIVETRLGHFLAYPALLVLMPLFLQNTNALSGILSARLSSKLHMGAIEPRAVPEPAAWVDIAINFTFAAVVFTFVGAGAQVMSSLTGRASPGAVQMVAISFTAGMMATVISSIVAYTTAMAAFRFGLDPDNFGIPISSSVMDLAGVVCLVAVILLYGVSAHG